jgi:phasin family protein
LSTETVDISPGTQWGPHLVPELACRRDLRVDPSPQDEAADSRGGRRLAAPESWQPKRTPVRACARACDLLLTLYYPPTSPDKENAMNPSDLQLPDFTQMLQNLSLPGVDVNALVASRRKDIEALVAANQRAQEGFKALVQRQTEILQETMRQAQEGGSNLGQSLGDAATRQAEGAKEAFEQALANMRELAEMAASSQTQAYEVLQARMKESVEETRQLLQPKSST